MRGNRMRKYVKKIAAITMAAAIVTGTAAEIFLQDPVAVCAAAKEMGPNKLQLKKVKMVTKFLTICLVLNYRPSGRKRNFR